MSACIPPFRENLLIADADSELRFAKSNMTKLAQRPETAVSANVVLTTLVWVIVFVACAARWGNFAPGFLTASVAGGISALTFYLLVVRPAQHRRDRYYDAIENVAKLLVLQQTGYHIMSWMISDHSPCMIEVDIAGVTIKIDVVSHIFYNMPIAPESQHSYNVLELLPSEVIAQLQS